MISALVNRFAKVIIAATVLVAVLGWAVIVGTINLLSYLLNL